MQAYTQNPFLSFASFPSFIRLPNPNFVFLRQYFIRYPVFVLSGPDWDGPPQGCSAPVVNTTTAAPTATAASIDNINKYMLPVKDWEQFGPRTERSLDRLYTNGEPSYDGDVYGYGYGGMNSLGQ